jgi:hypothetical protein
VLRACVLVGACAGLVAACSDDDDSSSGTTGGKGGSAGSSAQGGKSSGGSTAQGGKGGAAQGGKGGTAPGGTAGGGTSSAGEGGQAEAGTDAGGAGGQSLGGAGGEAGMSEAGAGGTGGDACPVYDAKLVPVDQSQLGGNTPDSWNLWDATGIGQFITSGKTGLLAAVELSIAAPSNEKIGSVEVYVYDALSNTKLGQAGVPMTALAGKNGGNLAADTIGPAFFDFASQCIHVTAAQKLRIDVHTVNTGSCVDLHCVGGPAAGNNCTGDVQCSGMIISASQPSNYAGGSITFHGVAGSADDNLNFKTFVAN